MNLKEDINIKAVLEKTKHFRAKNNENIRDTIVSTIYKTAEDITRKTVIKDTERLLSQQKIDDIVTSKKTGIPIMILLLAVIFWLTIQGSKLSLTTYSKILILDRSKAWFILYIYTSSPLAK